MIHQIWDTRTRSAIRRIIGVDICGNSILAYDGKIVSGSWRRSKQLQVFDLASGNLQAEYTTGKCFILKTEMFHLNWELITSVHSWLVQALLKYMLCLMYVIHLIKI